MYSIANTKATGGSLNTKSEYLPKNKGNINLSAEYLLMKSATPPPLIPCKNENMHGLEQQNFSDLFEYLYVNGFWYIQLPKDKAALKIKFFKRHFEHAFFKEPGEGEPRTVWEHKRAERLLWIGYTLENPTFIYKVQSSRFNVFCRLNDREAPWYLVVFDKKDDYVAHFITAYPISHDRISKSRSYGKLVYEKTERPPI